MPARATFRWISGCAGPVYTVSTACSSANHAIGQAFRLVRDGDADIAVTGGAEAFFTIGMLKAWEAMRVVAPDTCRPFSKDRRGMILGEGGAMMILEPMESARARGAKIYAEVCGMGMTSDAHHLTQPTIDGPARAMRGALREAGMAPEEIGYINAHGTGTRGQRSRGNESDSTKFSARTRTNSPSAPRSPCTATRWALPARSKPSPPFSRSITAFCRPPRISPKPIPNATSTTFRISRARFESAPRFRTPSLSADSTPLSLSVQPKNHPADGPKAAASC